ncbi:hypothetical protein [Arthrobacter sp. NPDC090010]|uniref:hypothetical protein n=1 Tax=Arthrobacter sp. NPDC090010 TaxID=3363942 RepID=UPI0037F4CEBC
MDQTAGARRVPARQASSRRARISTVLVSGAVVVGVAAHLVAAAREPVGLMAWWMAGMGVLCLLCLLPMVTKRHCPGRAAGHLMAMSAAMVLFHAVVVLMPGLGSHHGMAMGVSQGNHMAPMLLLIVVELFCMMGAAAALRLNRAASGSLPVHRSGSTIH